MRSRKSNIFYGIDLILVLLFFILIFLGWINIYSASVTEEHSRIFDLTTKYGKQLFFILLSFPMIILILMFEAKFYEKFSSIIYLISLISLVGLFILGKNINGATSWYAFGNFSLQPSEFVKAATALAIAKLVGSSHFNLKILKNQFQTFLILFLPAFFITLQPDPGSALVYVAFLFVLYREGLPIYYITVGFITIILFVITLMFGYINVLIACSGIFALFIIYLFAYRKRMLKRGWMVMSGIFIIALLYILSVAFVYNNIFEQRHRDRFNIILGKTSDVSGIGYNTNQSITTIASGGVTGKGFLEGDRTQGDFVPEQTTDYIFTTVGEEWGFIGSSFVILVFMLFLLRIIRIAERQKSSFSRIYGYSVAAIFFFHFMINIGMVIGILPTIGIPLPFFSYGGSALWGFTILLFIFLRLDANRAYEW